jgi:outer membrane receptor protein involved in Fe transport
MGVRANYAILFAATTAIWGRDAHAEGGNPEPSAPPALSDADVLKLSQTEQIEIYDERPDKPFDRDTEVRLSGDQLAARGATDLSSALALLPDVIVRDAGRGGTNIDVRGARKGEVTIFIDGVNVSDPYYGTFDLSSIPITDIVQIRLATAPQSPIDGPGGPGGVIEVHTRDAVGPQLVIARTAGDSLPSFGVTGSARVALAKQLALRLSASGQGGGRDLPLPASAGGALLNEDRHSATGSARLEYREGKSRVVLDGFIDERHYIAPPSDVMTSAVLVVDREATKRASIKGDIEVDKLQLEGQVWVHHLYRRSRFFADPALQKPSSAEDLSALRTGAMALATRPIGKEWRWAASATVDHESAEVGGGMMPVTGDVTLTELAGDLQYEHRTVRVDGAVGLAAPIGVSADPWPEGKLVGKWRPSFGALELTGTVARKGRVPSLRERFDPSFGGNPKLAPEKDDLVEARAIESVSDQLRIELAPFYRHTSGIIRADPMTMKLSNLGIVNFYGVDVLARVRVHPMAEVGGAYDYIYAKSETTGPNPLDRLPEHRGETWVQVTPDPRLTVLARVRFFGETVDQGTKLPSYTLLEGTVTAPVSKQYLAVLRVDDALDARPLTRNGYHMLGRVVSLVLQGQWE